MQSQSYLIVVAAAAAAALLLQLRPQIMKLQVTLLNTLRASSSFTMASNQQVVALVKLSLALFAAAAAATLLLQLRS